MENISVVKRFVDVLHPAPIEAFIESVKKTSATHIDDTVGIPLSDGRVIDFVVTDVDDVSVRFESRDCLGEYVPMTRMDEYFKKVFSLLPKALQEAIAVTERKHYNAKGEVVTSYEKLFLPAASEIFAPDDCYGDKGLYKQMEWYKDVHNRIRAFEKGGYADWYWTSSRRIGSPNTSTTHWCNVYVNGNADSNTASYDWIAAPVCFRIEKS